MDAWDNARMHREVCIALLDAYIPHGQRAAFERAVGISRRWYARVRDVYADALPSVTIAQRIARYLPAPQADRQAFLEHFHAARFASQQLEQRRRRTPSSVDDGRHAAAACRALAQQAQTSSDPARARQIWHDVRQCGQRTLATLSPRAMPLAYVEQCACLALAEYRVGSVARGLYWAKIGRQCAEAYDSGVRAFVREAAQRLELRFEIAHMEALGYEYLRLPEHADRLRTAAMAALPESAQAVGQVQLYGHRLATLPLAARFAVREAEWLAQRTEEAVTRLGWAQKAALSQHALADAYLARGNALNRRRARQIITAITDAMETIARDDLTVRAGWHITLARLHWHDGDHPAWQARIQALLAQTRYLEGSWRHRALIAEYGDSMRALMLQTPHDTAE
jgi:hypothetical protein